MQGKLHCDLFNLSHYMVNSVAISLTLTKSSPSYYLMGDDALDYNFNYEECFLRIRNKHTKTFNLTETKKGFFPHEFNRRENFGYIGSYSDKIFYNPKYFSKEKSINFDIWYDKMKNTEFVFQKELAAYCWSDVELLSEGCLQFCKLNQEASKLNSNDQGIDPMENNLTTPSFCNTLYRRNFMSPNSIAWIPANGFMPKENTSKKADLWLKFISESENIYIQHSKNQGEYKVDGISLKEKKIYEFMGCLYHGCEICNGENTLNPLLQKINSTLRYRTDTILKQIKEMMRDFQIIEIWEHTWDIQCKNDSKI